MKEFNKWLSNFKNTKPYYSGMKNLSGMQAYERDGLFCMPQQSSDEAFAAKPRFVTDEQWDAWITKVNSCGFTSLLECWVLSSFFSDGIKAYAPTVAEFMALSNVEINIPFTMYRQPFETVTIIIPDGLFKERVSHDIGFPAAVVVRCDTDKRVMCMTTICNETSAYFTTNYSWPLVDSPTIESRMGDMDQFSEMSFSIEEEKVSPRLNRAALNACLLLSQGTKRIGSSNQSYKDKLLSRLSKKGLSEAATSENIKSLWAIPEIYGLDQHIRVYDEVNSPSGEPTGEGIQHKPHWRRGHWANQACGEGWKERKLIFRRPAFINAHLFAGELSNTRVSMSLGGKRNESGSPTG